MPRYRCGLEIHVRVLPLHTPTELDAVSEGHCREVIGEEHAVVRVPPDRETEEDDVLVGRVVSFGERRGIAGDGSASRLKRSLDGSERL